MPSMSNVLGIIFANMHDRNIEDLTKTRTMGSVLFGGRYRLIDFPLSNMVNSGVTEVGVITKSNYQSLLDHLASGREWDLSRKRGGLHFLPPFGNTSSGIYRGRLEALLGAMSFLKYSPAEYVIMSDCDIVTNMDFRPILEAHIEKGADITMVSNKGEYLSERTSSSTIIEFDEDNRVYDVLINPDISGACNISLNICIVKKDLLMDIVQKSACRSLYSFERDVIQAKVKELKIYAYEYNNYFSRIDSIKSYFNANINLINPDNSNKLFLQKYPIYTKVRDNAPCKYGINSLVKNSLIADGCIIEGEVENSVLFRGVKIEKGAKIKNSIIMQDTTVGEKSDINYIITDKNVAIGSYRVLNGTNGYPLFVGKGASV